MIRRVRTENGWVRGLPAADPRITSYKGIPFAAPPVGELRWRAPLPCQDWEGDLFAADFGPIAMQANCAGDPAKDIYAREWAVDAELPMSEDCLYLNVWAPADGRTGLPVFVWYFGGGLQVGNTTEMEFDGERIARRGAVVVTVGYRLNVFGFLCHPELTREHPEAPGNFGFLDQQFATRWVKRNIASFGGDPDNITIGGQSAGGMSVCAQMCCKENEGLFRQAIVESGSFAPPYPFSFGLCRTLADAEAMGERFFAYLGISTLAQARAIDARTLEDKALSWTEGGWGEAVDGVFSHSPSQRWYLNQDRVKVPVLFGQTSSEFCAEPPADTWEALCHMAHETYGSEADRFLSCFTPGADAQQLHDEGRIHCIEFAMRAAAAANPDSPFYMYEFDPEIPGWDHPGTFHSVDLWFFFETLAKCWRPFTGKHYDLARSMCDYWVNFMRTGDPNGEGSQGDQLPVWPKMDAEAPQRMLFADKAEPQPCPPGKLAAFLLEQYMKKNA